MKKCIYALALACALTLSACDTDQAPQPDTTTVIVDEECPRADGEPCR